MCNRSVFVGGCCVALLATGGVLQAASMSGADKAFMNAAARIEMTEAHQGQMAQNQASRADVKDLGKSIAQDYRQSYDQLFGLAAKTGVAIPRGIDAARNPAIAHLKSMQGVRFDQSYAKDEIAANRRAIAVFKREADHGQDTDVKAYASHMLPVMQRDLQRAQACLKPSKRA